MPQSLRYPRTMEHAVLSVLVDGKTYRVLHSVVGAETKVAVMKATVPGKHLRQSKLTSPCRLLVPSISFGIMRWIHKPFVAISYLLCSSILLGHCPWAYCCTTVRYPSVLSIAKRPRGMRNKRPRKSQYKKLCDRHR